MQNDINEQTSDIIIPINDITDDCIFCQDKSNNKLINYEHTCGIYKIHQECLDRWFMLNSTSCIICRENIIESSSSSLGLSFPINVRNNEPENDSCKKYICIFLHSCLLLIIILIIFYL